MLLVTSTDVNDAELNTFVYTYTYNMDSCTKITSALGYYFRPISQASMRHTYIHTHTHLHTHTHVYNQEPCKNHTNLNLFEKLCFSKIPLHEVIVILNTTE